MNDKRSQTEFEEERFRQVREGLEEGIHREVERLRRLGLPICTKDNLEDFDSGELRQKPSELHERPNA